MDSGDPVLIDTGSGYTIKYRETFLYSSVKPESQINKKVDRLTLMEKTLFFIPSFGLGYGIPLLLKRLPQSSHILCVEVDEKLFSIALSPGAVALPSDSRLTILRTQDVNELLACIKNIGIWKFRRTEMCPLSRGFSLFREKYREMFHAIEQEIQQHWKNKMTFIHMAPLWIKNMFTNLSFLTSSLDIRSLGNLGFPLIVAGAGPSLEESIPEIKKMRKKVILMAVDTAFPCLYEQDLFPDFVFILESQVLNLHDFLICRDPGIPLICDMTSHPGVIRLFKKKKYLFTSRFSKIRLLQRFRDAGFLPTEFPALGSVGVAAVYAALHLTSGPVFLTGLDFGYTHHMTHARGTAHYKLFTLASSRLLPLENLVYKSIRHRPLIRRKGKQGRMVVSDLILQSYAGQIPGIVGNRKGVFDIGKNGLDCGLLWTDMSREIEQPGENSVYEQEIFESGPGFRQPEPGEVKNFLLTEMNYLHECENIIMPLVKNNTSIKAGFSEKVNGILMDVDYIYLHFPDQVSLPVCNRNFLFRALISIEHYKKVLARAMELVG